ncbi:MAG: type II toxin-antitoxin system RelE/ParE family toxin [Nanoarchaeota archaeon]
MLNIEFSNNSKKFLENCDDKLYNRLNEKIKELALDPYPKDRKKVEGRKEKLFRVRVGNYRILYIVFSDKNTLLISDIDKRDSVYN